MELSMLKIPDNKVNQLTAAGISKVEDLRYYLPKKYIDRTQCTQLMDGGESVFLFHCNTVSYNNNKVCIIEAVGAVDGYSLPVHIKWFNQSFIYRDIQSTKGKTVLVAGIVKYAPPGFGCGARFEVNSPAIYDPAGKVALGIYPAYKKVPGMAEEYLKNLIRKAATLVPILEETVPKDILSRHSLVSHTEMINSLHQPANAAALESAITRKRWDDLLYFALRIEMNNRKVSKGSIYGLQSLAEMNAIRESLPFTLTAGQDAALAGAIEHIRKGQRLNALIQGDVGCGKTIVAQLLMLAFATNGYQAAMMAPTQLLAKQHYESFCELCEPLGIPVYLVDGKTTGNAQKKTMAAIADGTAKLVVGTQALLSDKYKFANLALVVEDEEHKYGVLQREALAKKAAGGTHTVTMSATPIPRSLAQTLYGDSLQLFSINEKPPGRQQVQTGIATDAEKAIAFLRSNCGKYGRQAYVVCPMIAPSEKVEGVMTAEEAYKLYATALKSSGISVALVTGKTPKREADAILEQFNYGSISVLVSTTIIEVGINIPNANCIIIQNAERFGLAQLHQLRGRVGRGSEAAFCSLISKETDNPRLQAMTQYGDGFMIAQMDLQQRGAGDFLGTVQSGTERYLALALQYPEEYQKAQVAAQDLLDRKEKCKLVQLAEADYSEAKGGDIL